MVRLTPAVPAEAMAALAHDVKDLPPTGDAVHRVGAAGAWARLPALGLVEKVTN